MSLDRSTRARIAAEESAKFLDENFAPLDTSGCISLLKLTADEFAVSDSRGFNNVDASGLPTANRLKEFINAPDDETLQRVAEETNDPDLLEKVRDEQAARAARQFLDRHPEYLQSDSNLSRIINVIAHEHLGISFGVDEADEGISELSEYGLWTLQTIEDAYRRLLDQGLLEVPSNHVRKLNNFERLEIARLAASGQVEAALQKYLGAALGIDDPGVSVANDPALVPICNEAVLFVFGNASIDFSPTGERMAFIRQFAAGRPLNLRLVAEAWEQCKRAERDALRSQAMGFSDAPITREGVTEGLDELSDSEVESLYKGTRRHIARSGGLGVLD
jgi:hypothetical protein